MTSAEDTPQRSPSDQKRGVVVATFSHICTFFQENNRTLESGILFLERGEVFFRRYGEGERLMIALHGFGDSGDIFAPAAEKLGEDYVVYAVDLPFHGRTQWRGERYDAADLEAIVMAILNRENKGAFTWLGFSFGGRLALASLKRLARHLDQVVLIAPEGLGANRLCLPLIIPVFARRWLMRRLDDAAGWARWAERLHRWGVIDRLALRFVRYFTGDARRRHCLWNTWLSLGHFRVRRQWLKRFLRYHSLPMAVLASPEDPVIPFQTLAKRARRLPGLSLDEARGGHYQVLYNALHDWLGDRLRRP